MSISPLVIEFYYYRRAHFELKKRFAMEFKETSPDSITPHIEVNSETGQNENDPQRWRVNIDFKVGHKERNFPYVVEIGMTGYFRVRDGYPAEKAELLVQVNGASILYAAARDFVTIMSSRNIYPAMLLPSLSFMPEPSASEVATKELRGRKPKNTSKKK